MVSFIDVINIVWKLQAIIIISRHYPLKAQALLYKRPKTRWSHLKANLPSEHISAGESNNSKYLYIPLSVCYEITHAYSLHM